MELIKSFVEIKCPYTYKTEKIHYRLITETPLVECNGCENSCGSAICNRCIAKVKESLTETYLFSSP